LKLIIHNEKGNINEHIKAKARKVCYQEASRLFCEINQGRTSQPNKIKIKIKTSKKDGKAMPTLYLTSISCTQQNKNEKDVSEKETTT